MASQAFYAWDHLGRPVTPATPVREFVEKLKAAFPKAVSIFGWYSNAAHYEAVPPQDHTPYSATGWPNPNPLYVVHATDVMHRVDLGVDCHVLFPYWLGEAKAGRFPSLKYLIWEGQVYDVRNGWKPQASAGHFDHIHLSFRTDYTYVGLGSWSVTPEGDGMNYNESQKLDAVFNLYDKVKLDTDAVPDGKGALAEFEVPLTKRFKSLEAKLDKLIALVESIPAPPIGSTSADGTFKITFGV